MFETTVPDPDPPAVGAVGLAWPGPPSLAQALAGLRAAVEALASVDLAAESDEALRQAAVTDAAVPARREAIAACEPALVELARQAEPRQVRRAVAAIRDLADADGADEPPLPDGGPDPHRFLDRPRRPGHPHPPTHQPRRPAGATRALAPARCLDPLPPQGT